MRQPKVVPSLLDLKVRGDALSLAERQRVLSDEVLDEWFSGEERDIFRPIDSPCDREVLMVDPKTGARRRNLNFGSNNYLGLANHPHVTDRMKQALDRYGPGWGATPALNGRTVLHEELEERLARLKGKQAAVIFSSGYLANVGLLQALVTSRDVVAVDQGHHGSFMAGLELCEGRAARFLHNDVGDLEQILDQERKRGVRDLFVAVEGIYSMHGDLAPLDRLAALAKKYGAWLMTDDAHATGVIGARGAGAAEHFNVEADVPIIMGTLSKTLASTGGFIASSREIVNLVRAFAGAYIFSSSMTPCHVAGVIGALEVIDREPERRARLHENVAYAKAELSTLGISVEAPGAILSLHPPPGLPLYEARTRFHENGILLNAVGFPAVPKNHEIFRISMMATHTRADVDELVAQIKRTWG